MLAAETTPLLQQGIPHVRGEVAEKWSEVAFVVSSETQTLNPKP